MRPAFGAGRSSKILMRRFTALLLVTLLTMPGAAFAQTSQGAPQVQTSQGAPPVESVDVSKLGVDLSRIKRELAEPETASSDDSPLRFRFSVQVIGMAPRIDFLEGFSVNGPMPYGSPTHQEVLDVLTPKEYSSPTVPIYGLAVMAAQKLWQLSKKQRCEAEIAEYRRLVMQGVAIAAPRCTQ
jgi:hypothetical protein